MQCLCNMRRLHFRGEIRLFDSAESQTTLIPKIVHGDFRKFAKCFFVLKQEHFETEL